MRQTNAPHAAGPFCGLVVKMIAKLVAFAFTVVSCISMYLSCTLHIIKKLRTFMKKLGVVYCVRAEHHVGTTYQCIVQH